MKRNRKYGIVIGLLLTGNLLMAQADSAYIQGLEERIHQMEGEIHHLEDEIETLHHGKHSFMLSGFTNLTYHQSLSDVKDSKFGFAGFSPVMIWKPAKNVFFEAELHIEMEGGIHGGELHGPSPSNPADVEQEGITHIELGYAHMVYEIRDGIMLGAGEFLTPIGIYNERIHPSWINPLPVDPIGMGHGGPLPNTELGIQVRGGIQTGKSKVNYVVYLSNGPVLDDGTYGRENAGKLIYANFLDNNGNKALGGRLGYLPFSNSSLELGVSGQYADKIGDRGTEYEYVSAGLFTLDFNYIKPLSGIGLLRWSGQYSRSRVSDAEYQNSLQDVINGAPILYSFDNRSTYYYSIVSLRPIQKEKRIWKDSEFSIRFERGMTPEGSHWHLDEKKILVGYSFWLHEMSVVKLAGSFGSENILYAQFAYGF